VGSDPHGFDGDNDGIGCEDGNGDDHDGGDGADDDDDEGEEGGEGLPYPLVNFNSLSIFHAHKLVIVQYLYARSATFAK
jgi:hypothetical protein